MVSTMVGVILLRLQHNQAKVRRENLVPKSSCQVLYGGLTMAYDAVSTLQKSTCI